jgi:hypothetical protein
MDKSNSSINFNICIVNVVIGKQSIVLGVEISGFRQSHINIFAVPKFLADFLITFYFLTVAFRLSGNFPILNAFF